MSTIFAFALYAAQTSMTDLADGLTFSLSCGLGTKRGRVMALVGGLDYPRVERAKQGRASALDGVHRLFRTEIAGRAVDESFLARD